MPTTDHGIKVGDIVRVCRDDATDGIGKDSIGVVRTLLPMTSAGIYELGVDWIIVGRREDARFNRTSFKDSSTHCDADFYLKFRDVEVIGHV